MAEMIALPETAPVVVLPAPEPKPPTPQSWLSNNLRNIIAVALTGMVCYLAVIGDQGASSALIAAFSVLAGAIWGERAALKVPGKE